MNRSLHHAAFFGGLAAVCWLAYGYVGTNPLALAMMVFIGAFYVMGALELHRFHQATSSLARGLAEMPEPLPALGPWLDRIHPSLQNAVRLRIEGERVALPGPAMAPYLAGLLVLLGMLGTFLGMVVTLKGTGLALESATDVQAIRASLAAPVKGLGLAFGTSVAGVAASAMLGLMSALCRRERLLQAHRLDTRIATTLRVYSLAHQREESFKLLQRQAQAMPELVDRLQTMMTRLEQHHETLTTRLVSGQESFHAKAEAAYAGLASSVDQSLKQSLVESARAAGAAIQPVVESTMASIARETTALHHTVADTVQRQLEGVSARFDTATTTVADLWTSALAQNKQDSAALLDQNKHDSAALLEALRSSLDQYAQTFEQRAASLVNTVSQAHVELQATSAARDHERLAAWTQSLETMAASLRDEWQQAGEQTLNQQQQICKTLEHTAGEIAAQTQAHARDTLGEVAQLVQAAAEAPRAAAEVMAELRQKLSDGMARDNAMLEERSRIMHTLGTLLDALNHASTEQRQAIDALVSSSAALLEGAGTRLGEKLDEQTDKMLAAAAQITGSAVEVSSLGEAFSLAVTLFGQANDKMLAQLQRIEGALTKSMTRSDEQLAYYVAQAREIIDLSIMSQKQIVEDLQQLSGKPAALLDEA
jgi:hypothetical protein